MKAWPRYPVLHEINTWVWLNELGKTAGHPVTLANVPASEWDAIAALKVDAVWLMGVWERSSVGISIVLQNPGLLSDFRRALPDFSAEDVVGSPYCVRRYRVDSHLGGTGGLVAAREELARRGIRLILDFVPNHVAPDHPWTYKHPEYFVRGSDDDIQRDPGSFMRTSGRVFACGRDPYFPAWPDVLQLNAFSSGMREAAMETLLEVAELCDGVRCDMAMLVTNEVFERTWGSRAGPRPLHEYWSLAIPRIRESFPDFKFAAEAYWDLEWELQQQGFDFCYDKRLYDRMDQGDPENIRLHVCADLPYQEKLVRFLENHDETRAAVAFAGGKARAAAITILTLPGAKLLFDGQFTGRKTRLPVFLGRQPEETPDRELRDFYESLLRATGQEVFRDGHWRLCERSGWPANQSHRSILTWCWELGEEWRLVAINFSGSPSQALVRVPWDSLRGKTCVLEDLLSNQTYERHGDEMTGAGLYVSLGAWQSHLFRVSVQA